MLKIFRAVALAEGTSFLGLFAVSMPLKYWAGIREPNIYIGYIHGALFLVYMVMAVVISSERNWTSRRTFWVLLAGFLPFATYYLDQHLFRQLSAEETLKG